MDPDEILAHYGVKGMKWGVRKSDQTGVKRTPSVREGYSIDSAGRVTIPKGATVQRVVLGKTLFNKGAGKTIGEGVTYASFTREDKLRYEANFGLTKGLLVKEASTVATLRAKTAIKTPSPSETAQTYFETLKKNPEAAKQLRESLNGVSGIYGFKASDLDDAFSNPKSRKAYEVFSFAFDGGQYDKNLAGMNDNFISAVKSKGFNSIIDPADSTFMGTYDAPIAIFDGTKNLELASQYVVDKYSKKKVNELLGDDRFVAEGKSYIEKHFNS